MTDKPKKKTKSSNTLGVNGKAKTQQGRHKAVKLDRDKVQELSKQGVSATDIAKHQGVAVSTITRYLNSIKPLRDVIKQYSHDHADILTLSQLKKQAVEDLVVEGILKDPDKFQAQDLRLQKEVLHTMQGGKYYDHQSERLERGQASQITRTEELSLDVTGLVERVVNARSELDHEFSPTVQNTPENDDDNVIDVTPENG